MPRARGLRTLLRSHSLGCAGHGPSYTSNLGPRMRLPHFTGSRPYELNGLPLLLTTLRFVRLWSKFRHLLTGRCARLVQLPNAPLDIEVPYKVNERAIWPGMKQGAPGVHVRANLCPALKTIRTWTHRRSRQEVITVHMCNSSPGGFFSFSLKG